MPESRSGLQWKVLVSLSAFVFSAAQVIWIALFPFLAEKLELSLSTVIASFGWGSFLFVFGSPYWAAKSDVHGCDKILSLGIAALLISFALLVFLVASPFDSAAKNFAFLLLSRTIYGLIASAIVPVAQAIQADMEDRDSVAKAMATHSISLGLGRVAGLTLLVFSLDERFVENLLFIVLAVLGGTFLLSVNLGRKLPSRPTAAGEKAVLLRSWTAELGDIKYVVLIAFLFAAFVEAVNSSLAGRLQSLFQIDGLAAAQWSAKMLMAASVGIVLVQFLYRLLARREKRSLPVALVVGVAALFFGSVFFATAGAASQFYVAIALFVVGIGLIPPVYLSLLRANSGHSRGGRRAGIVGSAQTLGYAFGTGLSAVTFRSGTLDAGHVLCLIVLGLAAACVLQKREKKAASV